MGVKGNKKTQSVSVVELAEYFGDITTTHVQKLERDGVVKKIGRGVYDLKTSIQNYIQYLKRNGRETGADSYKGQRTRYYKAKADIEETKAAAIKGEFHNGECIAAVMNEGLAVVRTRLLALPTTAAPQVADISDVNGCLKILTDLIYEALSELSKYDGRKVVARYLKQQVDPEKEEEESSAIAF